MLKRYLFLAIIGIFWLNAAWAQKLKVGDKVPDIEFPIIINNNQTIERLSDLKGKLVILDYWNIWCSSCIAAFPKLDSLQQKFKEEVVILPVSFLHKKEEIEKFIITKKTKDYDVKLPLAVFETTKNLLFDKLPSKAYPHYIWIDKEGNFLYASNTYHVTEENIKKVLNGENLEAASLNFQMDFDSSKPFLIKNNGGPEENFVYRSMLTKNIDSIGSLGLESYIEANTRRMFIANKSIIELLKASLYEGRNPDVFNQYFYFEELDRGKFIFEGENRDVGKWNIDNSFCYELILPSEFSLTDAFVYMKQDLERFFRIRANFEERWIDCLVLIRRDNKDRISSKSSASSITHSTDGLHLKIRKRGMDALLAFITAKGTPIMFDDTGFKGEIDIDLQLKKPFDLQWMNVQLKSYGLELINRSKKLKVIVIR